MVSDRHELVLVGVDKVEVSELDDDDLLLEHGLGELDRRYRGPTGGLSQSTVQCSRGLPST